jgi:hypothetical protein
MNNFDWLYDDNHLDPEILCPPSLENDKKLWTRFVNVTRKKFEYYNLRVQPVWFAYNIVEDFENNSLECQCVREEKYTCLCAEMELRVRHLAKKQSPQAVNNEKTDYENFLGVLSGNVGKTTYDIATRWASRDVCFIPSLAMTEVGTNPIEMKRSLRIIMTAWAIYVSRMGIQFGE